jgi:hypothetical protein
MSALKAPAVAKWLLDLTGSNRWNDALAGDLLEEYQRRGSRTWYWREALTAIVATTGKDLLAHPVLALRTLVVAYLSCFAARKILHEWPGRHGLFHFGLSSPDWSLIVSNFTEILPFAVAGWVVARTHRAHRTTMVLWYAAVLGGFFLDVTLSAPHLDLWRFPQYRTLLIWRWTTALQYVIAALVGGLAGRPAAPGAQPVRAGGA